MWERIKRIFRSVFGAAVEAAEDPEKILKQNIRDMEDQVPKMNESIAMVKANVTIVEKQLQKLDKKLAKVFKDSRGKFSEMLQGEAEDDFKPVVEELTSEEAKVGRNDPCPCGSGKKHKKCCG